MTSDAVFTPPPNPPLITSTAEISFFLLPSFTSIFLPSLSSSLSLLIRAVLFDSGSYSLFFPGGSPPAGNRRCVTRGPGESARETNGRDVQDIAAPRDAEERNLHDEPGDVLQFLSLRVSEYIRQRLQKNPRFFFSNRSLPRMNGPFSLACLWAKSATITTPHHPPPAFFNTECYHSSTGVFSAADFSPNKDFFRRN